MTGLGRRADDSASRRVIDVAIGVLIGLRGFSEREAFDDLVPAVHDTCLGLSAVARALVDLAGGATADAPHQTEALLLWGHLLRSRAISTAIAPDEHS